mgnify:FL=1
MIQDIAPHIYHNEYCPEKPDADSYLMYFERHNALARWAGVEIAFPRFRDFPEVKTELSENIIYLFTVDDKRFYLVKKLALPERKGFRLESNRRFRDAQPQWLSFAGITGYQLWHWYDVRKYCGHCGSPMVHDAKERMMRCPDCGQMEYPKISPAVIVGILHKDKILMSKYAGRDNITYYALIAGFTEIGESIEETIRREVMEEVGLRVKNIRYYKSQPWAFSDTEMVGFTAELDGDDTICLEEEELCEAGWFTRDEIVEYGPYISVGHEMMKAFKDGKI